MHEYRRLVQSEMDKRGWTQAELARRSGVHKAVINRLFQDDRKRLERPPKHETIAGFARAFGTGSERRLWGAVAAAMGLPVGELPVGDASLLSDDELVREIANRLQRASGSSRLAAVPDVQQDRYETGTSLVDYKIASHQQPEPAGGELDE